LPLQEINKPIFEPVAPVEQSSPRPLSLSELSAEVPSDFHGNKIKQTTEQPVIKKNSEHIVGNDVNSEFEQQNHIHGSLQPGQPVRFN
jgi:hypothetical protein